MLPEAKLGASRLMEALEKLSQWAGDSTAGQMPSGAPSLEVVQAFEEALQAPAVESLQMAEDTLSPSGTVGLPDMETLPGPAEAVPSLVQPESTARSIQPVSIDFVPQSPEGIAAVQPGQQEGEIVRELGHLLQDISRPGIAPGPETLFRAQYLMGILKAQSQAGVKASQQVSQGMENMLRQQG